MTLIGYLLGPAANRIRPFQLIQLSWRNDPVLIDLEYRWGHNQTFAPYVRIRTDGKYR